MTTDPTSLQERIARALYGATFHSLFPDDLDDAPQMVREVKLTEADAVLPLITTEVRKAQADAWDEGYGDCWTYHQSEGMKGTERNPYREQEN